MPLPIRYTITPSRPEAHLFHVTCTVDAPDSTGQRFSLPVWIPGSYMVREFARNIITIAAHSEGEPVGLEKRDKTTWQADAVPAGQSITLAYEVYAWDLSVRAAHLDRSHGFFNGTSVFVAVEGQTDRPCELEICPPMDEALGAWQVATTLPPAGATTSAMDFGTYHASDYDELVDHPVEMGTFTHAVFEAGGVRHEISLTGHHDCDTERLCADLAKVCAWQIALFGAPAPVTRYLFLAMIVGDGYGGLEHRASTALLASRKDLPWRGMSGVPEGYKTFLGLCSHEYFHTWNVKRIKPAAFVPYDFARENYTRLLWAFEGFTSYYDDLALLRSGVIGVDDYLGLIAKTMSNVLRGSGRLKQSVAESSFDAWTKFYRQDENAPNAIVSYYAKGALIALALDLQLRLASEGACSLDDVMRLLWQRHGQTGIGVEEEGIFEIVAEVAERGAAGHGHEVADWLRTVVSGTEDLPLERLLGSFAIDYRALPVSESPVLGIKLAAAPDETRVANVFDGGPAQAAGVSAGDVLVALDGLRVQPGNLEAMLARRSPGEQVELYAFRRDELLCFNVELAAPPADSVKLSMQDEATPDACRLRSGWLGS